MKARKLGIIVGFLAAAAVSAPFSESQGSTKKTVCTITINSSEEADAFRRHLAPDQWTFTELVNPETATKPGWFRGVCERKVECDILVISGHFGGSFFGSNSDIRLSMEELEGASCQKPCDGIFDRPKEVFLFGCNTLASKDRDTRTPEEYRRVLVADGFSNAQASQIAAFRYSAFGESFRARMAQVFSKTPRIYGFSALAPSGVTAEPLLNRYFEQNAKFYSDFEESNLQLKTGINASLRQVFSLTTLAQVPGLTALQPSANRSDVPYCYLGNQSETRIQKLKYIQASLHEGRAFSFISHIEKFVNESSTRPWNREERLVIEAIGSDPKTRQTFNRYLLLSGEVYLPVRVGVLNLMRAFDLIPADEYEKRIFKELQIDLSRPLKRTQVEKICSHEVHVELRLADIPEVRWKDYETFSLLRCLHPQNLEVHNRLVDLIESDTQAFNAAWTLTELKPSNRDVQNRLAQIMISHSNPEVRIHAIDVLSETGDLDPKIARDIMRLIVDERNWTVRQEAAYAFRTIRTDDIEILKALVQVMLYDEVWSIRAAAADALRIQDSNDPSVRIYKSVWDHQIK